MPLVPGAEFQQLTMQDAAVATGNGNSFEPTSGAGGSYALLTLQVTGITTATITVEGTIDNTNWSGIPVHKLDDQTTASTITANGIYRTIVSGLKGVRARISAYTSGTISIHGVMTSASDELGFKGGGGAEVGGVDTQVQYNDNGELAGDAGMTYDDTNDALTVTGRVVTPIVRPSSDGVTAVQIQSEDGTVTPLIADTTNGRVAINGTPVGSAATMTVRQHVDINGLRLYGFDDRDADYIGMGVNGSGTGFFSTTGNMLFTSAGTNLQFKAANASGTLRFLNNSNDYILYGKQDLHVGLGDNANPTAFLDLPASTTSEASLRIRSGTAPTSPNAGDLWFDGTNLKFYDGSTTRTLSWT